MDLENCCIPRRHMFFGQTTKQPLKNFEPQKPWKHKHFWGLRSDPSCLEKNKYKKIKAELLKQCVMSLKKVVCQDRTNTLVARAVSIKKIIFYFPFLSLLLETEI